MFSGKEARNHTASQTITHVMMASPNPPLELVFISPVPHGPFYDMEHTCVLPGDINEEGAVWK